MRQRSFWAWVLALGVSLGTVGLARADDDASAASNGNWFTRMFRRQPAAPKTDEKARVAAANVPQAESAAQVRVRAQMELMRRQEVCDKMREIAFQTSDDELRRQADQLDQRAWDAYVQKTSRVAGTRMLTPDEQALESRLMGGTGQQVLSGAGAAGRRPNQSQAASRGGE
ncbi:MAG: hypothetical protein HY040_09825 [Planctomycetes bacterium]|nr:hypothetical protein [Planctomycetota bacterium]